MSLFEMGCTFQATRYIIGNQNIDSWNLLIDCQHIEALNNVTRSEDGGKNISSVSALLLKAVILKDMKKFSAYEKAILDLDTQYPPSTKNESHTLVNNLLKELYRERKMKQMPKYCH